MLNDLLLLSGNDIPFEQAQLIIHQPTIKEIAYIGEEKFYSGCEFLRFSKDNLSEEDRIHLEQFTNFEILMSILKDKTNAVVQQNKVSIMMVLTLIFPDYAVQLKGDCISLIKDEQEFKITKENFEDFKNILNTMFCLSGNGENPQDYNPKGEMARKIAEKLKKGREKSAALKGDNKKVAILSRYISILSVGENKNMHELLQYTVYQLFDEFKRFELKAGYDIYLQAKMAGAKDLEEVDDWMKDIHP